MTQSSNNYKLDLEKQQHVETIFHKILFKEKITSFFYVFSIYFSFNIWLNIIFIKFYRISSKSLQNMIHGTCFWIDDAFE